MSNKYVPAAVGFRRLNKEPLDYYETFTSLKSAITYCKKGSTAPYYNGQRISVIFDTKHTQEYIIKNNKLFPLLNGGQELIIQTVGTNKWILIYYNNTSSIYSESEIGESLVDPYKYSILNNLELFRNDNDGFDFRIITGGIESRWQQTLNPVTDAGTAKFYKINNASGYFCKDTTVICPKVSNAAIVSLYVNATAYLSEVGL